MQPWRYDYKKLKNEEGRGEIMRDYQNKSPYTLERNAYMQTIYFIRSLDELEKRYQDILDAGVILSNTPRGTTPGDPTLKKVIKLSRVADDIAIINKALKVIPEDYRREILNNIIDKQPFNAAQARTLRRHRAKYIYTVAELKGII